MDSSKVIDFLGKQKKELEILSKKHYKEGKDDLKRIENQIRMIIRRIYPNYKQVEGEMFPDQFFVVTDDTDDSYWQELYLDRVKIIDKAIDTILAESELFGLEDFTPEKEKSESEVEVSTRRIGWRRKKTK